MNRTNYIFVDYENIRDFDLSVIEGKPARVILMLGARTKTLPLELSEKLHQLSSQTEMIRVGADGKNALDLALAFQIGRKAAAEPKSFFHILSRDHDFEPLVKHLTQVGLRAGRYDCFEKIPLPGTNAAGTPSVPAPKARAPASTPDRVNLLVERFAANKNNRPKKQKTLQSHLRAFSKDGLADEELSAVIAQLIKRRVIAISATGAVTYPG